MHVYGTRAEHFGMQAVAQRFHASRNPNAIMPRRDHARRLGRVAADRRADPAVRLLARERRRDRGARDVARARPRPAPARGPRARAGAVRRADPHRAVPTSSRRPPRSASATAARSRPGRRLFAERRRDARPTSTSRMIVEPFTVAVPLALEQYGFCAMGEGGPFIESGATRWPDGALPVNTHGGSNGEAFIHGVNHLPEAVRQLRGTGVQPGRRRRGRVRVRRDQRPVGRGAAGGRPVSERPRAWPEQPSEREALSERQRAWPERPSEREALSERPRAWPEWPSEREALSERPRPAPGTEHWPFWEACRRHELAFERCGDCGRFRHHPRPRCPSCQSPNREWATVDGRGVVVSWTVLHPPVLPAFEAVAPYNAVVVHLPGPDVFLVEQRGRLPERGPRRRDGRRGHLPRRRRRAPPSPSSGGVDGGGPTRDAQFTRATQP